MSAGQCRDKMLSAEETEKYFSSLTLNTFRCVNILITDNDDELFNKVSLQH